MKKNIQFDQVLLRFSMSKKQEKRPEIKPIDPLLMSKKVNTQFWSSEFAISTSKKNQGRNSSVTS